MEFLEALPRSPPARGVISFKRLTQSLCAGYEPVRGHGPLKLPCEAIGLEGGDWHRLEMKTWTTLRRRWPVDRGYNILFGVHQKSFETFEINQLA